VVVTDLPRSRRQQAGLVAQEEGQCPRLPVLGPAPTCAPTTPASLSLFLVSLVL
jgi:hypothetical protein